MPLRLVKQRDSHARAAAPVRAEERQLIVFSRCNVPACALLAAATLVLGGCASQNTEAAPAAVPATSAASSPAASAGVTVVDPWVKAVDKGMTAAFGTLVNTTDAEVTVVSGSSPRSKSVELHEVVDSGGEAVMRQKEGGFTIPAGGRHELRPGGDHIMLMGVTEAVKPGDVIPFTLVLKDGTSVEFEAVAKDFSGGSEEYHAGSDDSGSGTDGHDAEEHG